MQEDLPLLNQKYSFELQNMALSMMLSEKEEIEMEIFHRQSGMFFELFINQPFMNDNPFLTMAFGSPKTLFQDLIQNINKISVNQEGIITCTMIFNSRSMPLKFNAKEKKMGPQQKILRLIAQLKKDQTLKIESLKKDQDLMESIITNLGLKIESLQKDQDLKMESLIKNQQLKNEQLIKDNNLKMESLIKNQDLKIEQLIKDHNLKINSLEKDNLMLKQKMNSMVQLQKFHETNQMMLLKCNNLQNANQEIKNQLQIQRDNNAQQNRQITILRAQLKDYGLRVEQLKEEQQTKVISLQRQMENKEAQLAITKRQIQNVYKTIYIISSEENTQIMEINKYIIDIKQQKDAYQKITQSIKMENQKRFDMQRCEGKLNLKRIGNNGYYGYIHPNAIKVYQLARLQVKQLKSPNQKIWYGIATDKLIGLNNPHYHLECKTYRNDNYVYQNAQNRAGGGAINDGMTITIIADLANSKIIWESNGNKLAEAEISAAMKANKLYFIIIMYYVNDEVQILDN